MRLGARIGDNWQLLIDFEHRLIELILLVHWSNIRFVVGWLNSQAFVVSKFVISNKQRKFSR